MLPQSWDSKMFTYTKIYLDNMMFVIPNSKANFPMDPNIGWEVSRGQSKSASTGAYEHMRRL